MLSRSSVNRSRVGWLLILAFVIACFPAGALTVKGAPAKTNEKPGIAITRTPSASVLPGESSWGTIAGVVRGPRPKGARVVLYALGDTWYVQPYIDAPFTEIGSDGRFSSGTHGGYRYAALLVTSSFKPPATTAELPRVGGEVLAATIVKPKE